MSCQICLEDYKGKKVVKITCQYCPSNACRGCLQRYMLQSYEDPHCMDCKRGWSSEFMAANFPLVFRNDILRKHRRKILLEREKAMLPAMQIFVEYKRNMAKYNAEMDALKLTFGDPYARPKTPEGIADMKKSTHYRYTMMRDERSGIAFRLRKVRAEIAELKVLMGKAIDSEYMGQEMTDALKEEILAKKLEAETKSMEMKGLRVQRMALHTRYAAMEEPFKELEHEHNDKRDLLNAATTNYWRNRRLYEGTESAEGNQRREFIMKCADDGCRGFLSSAYKCGTCEKWTCSQCLVVVGTEKDAPHTCDPNTVETAKAIKTETRPCPKCGTRIFKIDGCDQMWCVMEGCGTAFSWNTGHVVTGTVHNPHYYEWLRRTGGGVAREVGDIPCGGLPAAYQLINVLRPACIPPKVRELIIETHRNIRELIDMRLRDYPARPAALANKELDVEYLMNTLTEAEWQRQLELSEARFNRKKEIGQILQTLATAGSDLMNHIVNQGLVPGRPTQAERNSAAELYAVWLSTTAVEQLEQLRVFGNDSLKALAKRDRMAVPQFEEMWNWKGARALYRPAKAEAAEAAQAAT